jgi:phage-related protein
VKPLIWIASSLEDVKALPAVARKDIGYQLYRIQEGLAPSDWKPMNSIGVGVREIRIHAGNEYRVIYVAKFNEAIYVLHTFVKKTAKTSTRDVDLATERFSRLLKKSFVCHCERSEAISGIIESMSYGIASSPSAPRNDKLGSFSTPC